VNRQGRNSKINTMKRFLIFATIAIVLAGGVSLWLWDQYDRFLETPLKLPDGGYVMQIEPGTPGRAIIGNLANLGFTRLNWEWKLLMRLEPLVIRTGEFALQPGLRPQELLRLLSSGEVIQYRLTLVEGWTFAQLLGALARDEILQHTLAQDNDDAWDHAWAGVWDGAWPKVLDSLALDHPEGWFLPETYQFTRGDSDSDILARSHEAMKIALEEAWIARDDDLPLNSPYELLILASIIEKETSLEAERPQIAGVFMRRLKKGMRLQTDPTVIYGMADSFDGNIRRKDLQTDTPYNTYTRSGLPPTPIAMPGRASLMAAARPAAGDALYFVADGTGGHTFSATLEEHQAAVKKMIGRG